MSRLAHATFAAPGLEAERRNLDATVRHEAAQRAAARIHIHDEQFDGAMHPWCGRGKTAVPAKEFEATDPKLRCRLCEREWFPNGQPQWHLKAALRPYAARSISDDDLCATCANCLYSPGMTSSCSKGWPTIVNPDGYITECASFQFRE